MNIEMFPKLSMNNRDEVSKLEKCGCYACVSVFESIEVREFTDGGKTALCPLCGIDAVLPGVTDQQLLRAGLERWFTGR